MEGYYQTPNKMIPLNDREPGEIADIAKEQLAAYQSYAKLWSVYLDPHAGKADVFGNPEVRMPMRCSKCHQAIWFLCDQYGKGYDYTDDEILALTVAHIRQAHPEVKI